MPVYKSYSWLPDCPFQVYRTLDNCYPLSRALLDSFDSQLNPALVAGLPQGKYGCGLSRIIINCAMSFYDGPHCKTNYIIPDESLRLRKSDYYSALLAMYPEEEIKSQGLYLRPRFDIGPLRKDTETVLTTIVFEKAFSEKPLREQKAIMTSYFIEVVRRLSVRHKKLPYDFSALLTDLTAILTAWSSD